MRRTATPLEDTGSLQPQRLTVFDRKQKLKGKIDSFICSIYSHYLYGANISLCLAIHIKRTVSSRLLLLSIVPIALITSGLKLSTLKPDKNKRALRMWLKSTQNKDSLGALLSSLAMGASYFIRFPVTLAILPTLISSVAIITEKLWPSKRVRSGVINY